MTVLRGLLLPMLLVLAGCASTQAPPERPIVVEAEQKPFEVKPYEPPADTPEASKPVQGDTGKYRLSVASAMSTEDASRWVQRAESLGYIAEVETATIGDETWYRVVLPGYRTRKDVLTAIGYANADFGITNAWRLPNEGSGQQVPAAEPAAAGDSPLPDSGMGTEAETESESTAETGE